jgi:hypothetical protein
LIASPLAISSIRFANDGPQAGPEVQANLGGTSAGSLHALPTAEAAASTEATAQRPSPPLARDDTRVATSAASNRRELVKDRRDTNALQISIDSAASRAPESLNYRGKLSAGESAVNARSNTHHTSGFSGNDQDSTEAPLFDYQTAAMGPVEALALNADGTVALTILGQTFAANSDDVSVAIGDYAVFATDESGELAMLMPVQGSYIPGASPVWVAGTVGTVDNALGQFSVGNASFDYTAMLVENPTLTPSVGDAVDMFGVQPVMGGRVLLGISGSDGRGISGSDGRGISGSDGRGISGSDGRGISGSDGRGISGSDGRGISGSDGR